MSKNRGVMSLGEVDQSKHKGRHVEKHNFRSSGKHDMGIG